MHYGIHRLGVGGSVGAWEGRTGGGGRGEGGRGGGARMPSDGFAEKIAFPLLSLTGSHF